MHSPPNITRHATTRPYQGGVRYFGELLVGVVLVCITLHTFFLAGLIVPVTVSGGSMAETILGPRRELVCPHCGITFDCGHERLPASGRAICLNCSFRDADLEQGLDWPGEHALIDRASLAFRSPRRWEVLVFRCPEQADTYCIKRVVGLPGEEIRIRAGDVYVNGQIARKNLAQCREVAQLVHDASFVPRTGEPIQDLPGWRAAGDTPLWHATSPGMFLFDAVAKPTLNLQQVEWLEFHAAGQQPITDDDSYNQSESRRLNPVCDVMLSCELRCTGTGECILRSEIDQDRFELRINPSQQLAILQRHEKEIRRVKLEAADFTGPTSLEFVRFDRQIIVAIGGKQVMREQFLSLPVLQAKSEPASQPPAPPWAIGASTLRLEVGHLRLMRDIYYTVPTTSRNAWGIRHPVTLSADEFFVLGDNSPISADSRIQDKPGIGRKSLIGRLLTTW